MILRILLIAVVAAVACVAVQHLLFDESNPAITGGVVGAVTVTVWMATRKKASEE